MTAADILTREEIATTVGSLHQKMLRGDNALVNLAIFRLSACCGLRRCEIYGLNVDDIILDGPRPAIRIPKAITKGQPKKRKARLIPLWWDKGTRDDLAAWMEHRRTIVPALPGEPLLCDPSGKRIQKASIARRWRTAIKCLGRERVKQLHIHCGRHTFISHALHGGRGLAEVRDTAGHANIATTSLYLHALANEGVADLFDFSKESALAAG
jgi:integrase